MLTIVACAIDAAVEQLSAAADLWWHLATGRYIVQHLAIPRHDVFSYTNAGARWVNPEWLADVLLYGVFRLGDGMALAISKVVVTTVFLGTTVWVARRRSGSAGLAVGSGIAAAMLCRPFLDIRPDLLFLLATAVTIAIIDAYRRGARPAVLLLLPPAMVIWANVHASFVYGLGLIGLFTAWEVGAALVARPRDPVRRRRAFRLALASAVAVAVCLVNPEGPRAFTFPFAIGGPDEAVWRTRVVEWTPPVLFGGGGFDPPLLGCYLVALVLATVAASVIAPRRLDVPGILLVAVTASMALRARRFVPVLALVAVPLLATGLAVIRDRLVRRSRPAIDAAATIACGLVALGYLGVRLAPEVRRVADEGLFARMIDASFFPRSATEFLRLNPLPARLFHPYAWGGYLEFHDPDRKVFIDGRGDFVFPADFYRENLTAEFAQPGWRDVLDRHGVALVLWPSASEAGVRMPLLRELLGSEAWRRIYDDGDAIVFAHVERGGPWLEAYRRFGLAYPENARARLFQALSYLDGGAFDRAREALLDIPRRFPDGEAVVGEGEWKMGMAAARAGARPIASFALGFLREVRGDGAAALRAYRAALADGLGEPYATHARGALDGEMPQG